RRRSRSRSRRTRDRPRSSGSRDAGVASRLLAVELEAYRQRDPYGHGLLSTARGLEAPRPHRFDGGAIEIDMSGRARDSDLADVAVREHDEAQGRDAL